MTQTIVFEGTTHEFPDDFTDADIAAALAQEPVRSRQAPAPRPAPTLTPQQRQTVGRQAYARQVARQIVPFGLGPLVQPLGDTLADPARRQAAGEDIGNAARSVVEYWRHPPTPQQWWDQTTRGIGEGLSQVPGNVVNAVTHPLTTARAMTYGPFEDEERGQQALDVARATGDVAELPRLARAANASSGEAAINVAGLIPAARVASAGGEAGLRGLMGQMARGAREGAIYGGGAGYLLTPGDAEQRAAGAASGAGTGATLGAALPPVVNTTLGAGRLAARGVGAVWDSLPVPANPESSVGMGGRPMRLPRRTPPTETLDPAAAGAIDRLAQRARMGPDDVRRALQAARTNPQGQVTADIFGDPGVRTTRSLVQAPGETGQRSLDVARTRFREMPGRIINGLRGALNVGETRQQAMARLNGDYARMSAENYRPILEQQLTPEQSAQMAADFRKSVGDMSMDLPVMRRARQRAEQLFNMDLANGDVTGTFSSNLPRMMHYLKCGLDDTVRVSMRRQGGLGANELRGVTRLSARLRNALDEVIPGYRQAREQWGTTATAEDALDRGVAFTNMRPEEIQSEWRRMSPFEREHARIGFVDEIQHSTRGGTNRNVNVARVLDDPDIQGAIRVMFDDPAEAAAYLEGTVGTQYRLGENAAQWRGNSQTASNLLHNEDNAAAAEALGHTLQGNPAAGAAHLGRHALNVVTAGALEHHNNRVGEALLRRVDAPEAKQFAEAVVAELRRRQRLRQQNAIVSGVGATEAGLSRREQD